MTKEFGPPCLVFLEPVVLLDSDGDALLVTRFDRLRRSPMRVADRPVLLRGDTE
jgi:hypothetical protein